MTMIIVFAVIGLLLGALTGTFAGALAGAALGYAIGVHVTLKARLQELEDRQLRDIRDPVFDRAAPPPQPVAGDIPAPAAVVPPAKISAREPLLVDEWKTW